MRSSLALLVLLFFWPGSLEAKARAYLLVIGENRSLDPSVASLQYADDDAAKNWEMFSLYADHSALFSLFDDESARLHPEAAERAEVPERAAIFDRLATFNQEMAADLSRGDEPELFLFYAGHGDTDASGEGYITLHDSKLSRTDLYREIVGPSKARFVHVVVDACKSYFLVNARGETWKNDAVPAEQDRSDAVVRGLLLQDELGQHPRAGVIVATSGDQKTHEWSRYRGGILSHEIRSALSGAADVNDDGRIEYSEVHAFLVAANARVRNPEVRLDTFARPPQLDRHRPLVDLGRETGRGAGRFLKFARGMRGHYVVEDERGVRYAELNKDADTSFSARVPADRSYFVRRDEVEETEIASSSPKSVDLQNLRWSRITLAARGALDVTFRQDLYGVPYGRSFYDGFVATSGDLPVVEPKITLETEVKGAAERPLPHHLEVGYLLGTAPAGDAGTSHTALLKYSYALGAFDLGLIGEIGYGSGGPTTGGTEALKRFAFLGSAGAAFNPVPPLALRLDVAAGWQILSGRVEIDRKVLAGNEAKGLRAELAAGVSFVLVDPLIAVVRGGLAVDGVYATLASSTRMSPFAVLGLALQL